VKSLIGLLLPLTALAANEVSIDPDRMLVVNGQRAFVLGLYENPTEDSVLDEAARAGFNLIQSAPDAAQLDRLHNRGVYAWINTGYDIDFSVDAGARKTALSKLAGDFVGHPAMLVWEVPDEALWNVWYGTQLWRNRDEVKLQNELIGALEDKTLADALRAMRENASRLWGIGEFKEAEQTADEIWRKLGKESPQPNNSILDAPERAAKMAAGFLEGFNHLKSATPKHPVWMNHAPRNSVAQRAAFNNAADIVGCDIYPVPPHIGGHSDLLDRGLTSVGAYTRTMQDAAPGKPVWMVLQGFSWAELQEMKDSAEAAKQRHPRENETRFMAYDAIVNGARGILYWGTAYTDKEKFWPGLLTVVRELADLSPVLSAPDSDLKLTVSYDETWGSIDRGIRVLAKNADDGVWFIVVNEYLDPLTYTLRGLESLDGVSYSESVSGDAKSVEKGALEFTIEPYGVHVLRPKK